MPQQNSTSLQNGVVPLSDLFKLIPLQRERNEISLAEQAYEHILAQIVFPDNADSYIQYGGKITESKIANALQVSNGPVREAIFRLREEGWIKTIGNRGSYLVDFSDPQIAGQIYRFRLAFETGAFYTLAAVISDQQIEELNAILTKLEKAKEQSDIAGFRQADIMFHLQVVEFAGGPQYKEVYRSKLLQWYAMTYYQLVETMGRENYSHHLEASGRPSHRDMFNAIAGHNSSLAAELISQHFALANPDKAK